MENKDQRIRELHDMMCGDGPFDFKRSDAILLVENMFEDMELEDTDVTYMSNDELREELCMSGLVHDSDMGEIIN